MAFDGSEGQQITLSEASTLTANHRTANPNTKLGHFMGKELINSILAQTGCVGIRTYHCVNSLGERELVMVGVDANENDIVSGIIADRMVGSPPNGGNLNPLNS